MKGVTTIGVDLGATHIRTGAVRQEKLSTILSERVNPEAGADAVVEQIFRGVDKLMDASVAAIGIGVPGLVNSQTGMVFDVLNIPSWKEMPLRQVIEDRYQIPVFVNNDANCFALGEYYFGKGAGSNSMVGLTIGSGLGSGIILFGKLYSGKNCGAGEFGMIDYLDHYIEYYASGQFFQNVYGVDGEAVFRNARNGDSNALAMYEEMGSHLGHAIKTILYALEPDKIILGGSVRHAYPYFRKKMHEKIDSFAYKQTIEKLSIEISELENSGILGAASLYVDSINK